MDATVGAHQPGISTPYKENQALAIVMIGSRGLLVSYSGLETHVRELAGQLAGQGHQVTVYGRAERALPQLPAVDRGLDEVRTKDTFCLGGKLTATLSSTVSATCDALRGKRPDVLHFHGVGCVLGVLIGRSCGIPTVLSLHSTNWQERKKWSWVSRVLIRLLERLAVRLADEVTVVSRALASCVRSEHGILPAVIPNGVREKGNADLDGAVLQEFGLQAGRFILCAGRITPDKGCHVVLDAFERAHLDMQLVFAGPPCDEPYLDQLKKREVPGVLFTGMLGDKDLGALYRRCWLFCSASVSEGQSIVVLEALAHSASCLVSDIPAHRELALDTDMLFGPDNVEELSRKLAGLADGQLESTPRTSHWLDENVQYRWESVAAEVLRVYHRTCSRKH